MERGDGDQLSFSFSVLEYCKLVSWAPDGVFLAHTFNNLVLIRNTKDKMSVLKTYAPRETVDQLEWSADSTYLAVGSFEDGILRIHCCYDSRWHCCINMGNKLDSFGMQEFSWNLNPRTHQLITTAWDYLKLTVWSLNHKTVKRIKHIQPVECHKSFTLAGDQLAIAKYKCGGRTFIAIYDTISWNRKTLFPCNTNNFCGLKWCPDSSSILVWDSSLFSHMYIFSPTGSILKQFSPDGLSLGINAVDWSPSGQILGFTNHSNKFRLLNGLTYGLLLENYLDDNLLSSFPNCEIFTEKVTEMLNIQMCSYSLTLANNLPKSSIDANLETKSSDSKNLTQIKFSPDGFYLAAFSKLFSNKLWVWDISKVTLCSVLVQMNPIEDFAWCPNSNMICFCTGTNFIYFWSIEKVFFRHIPEDNFNAISVNWNQEGDAIAISSNERFTVCLLKS